MIFPPTRKYLQTRAPKPAQIHPSFPDIVSAFYLLNFILMNDLLRNNGEFKNRSGIKDWALNYKRGKCLADRSIYSPNITPHYNRLRELKAFSMELVEVTFQSTAGLLGLIRFIKLQRTFLNFPPCKKFTTYTHKISNLASLITAAWFLDNNIQTFYGFIVIKIV